MSKKEERKVVSKGILKTTASLKSSIVNAGLHRNGMANLSEKLQDAQDKKVIQQFSRQASDSYVAGGASGVDMAPLTFMDPLFDPVIMMFPKDNVRELNRRLRHYYTYNPYIRNIINLHSSFPLSDFDLKCVDPSIEKYFNEFKERKDLLNTMIMLATDYWLLGEGFLYGNWNEYEKEFETFNQYPPEDIEIKNTYMNTFVYLMKPNDNIRKQLKSSDPIDQQLNDLLQSEMPEFVDKMRAGKPYIFDNKRFIHLAARPNKYTPRGISPVLAAVKDLMYEDRLRLLQTTFVDRHAFPLKIFKIGSKELGWVPPVSKYREFEKQLIAAASNPDFSIVTHPFIEVDYVTGSDKIMDLIPQFDLVAKRYMVALFVNDAVLHGELGPYASQAISLKVLMNKYMAFREQLAFTMKEKIFSLLCKARGFVIRKQADLAHGVRTSTTEYDTPKVFWKRANLMNNRDMIDFAMRMRESGEIPFKYVAEMFDWDVAGVREAIKEEEGTNTDKLWRAIREKKSENDKVANQILEGTKTDELKLDEPAEESAAEGESGKVLKPIKEPKSLADIKDSIMSPGGGGGSMPAAPAAPSLSEAVPEVGGGAPPAGGKGEQGLSGLSEALQAPQGESQAPTI